MLICYGQNNDRNRVDTFGNKILIDNRVVVLIDLTLLVAIFTSLFTYHKLIENTDL